MRRVVVAILCLFLLGLCHQRRLPHRHSWELFKQANSPSRNDCQSPLMAYYLDMDDGTQIFLECQRGFSNE